jgi:hypothetical protein
VFSWGSGARASHLHRQARFLSWLRHLVIRELSSLRYTFISLKKMYEEKNGEAMTVNEPGGERRACET